MGLYRQSSGEWWVLGWVLGVGSESKLNKYTLKCQSSKKIEKYFTGVTDGSQSMALLVLVVITSGQVEVLRSEVSS